MFGCRGSSAWPVWVLFGFEDWGAVHCPTPSPGQISLSRDVAAFRAFAVSLPLGVGTGCPQRRPAALWVWVWAFLAPPRNFSFYEHCVVTWYSPCMSLWCCASAWPSCKERAAGLEPLVSHDLILTPLHLPRPCFQVRLIHGCQGSGLSHI